MMGNRRNIRKPGSARAATAAGIAATSVQGVSGAAATPSTATAPVSSTAAGASEPSCMLPPPPPQQPEQQQQAGLEGEDQQAGRRHKRKATDPRRVAPAGDSGTSGEAVSSLRHEHTPQQQDEQPVQHVPACVPHTCQPQQQPSAELEPEGVQDQSQRQGQGWVLPYLPAAHLAPLAPSHASLVEERIGDLHPAGRATAPHPAQQGAVELHRQPTPAPPQRQAQQLPQQPARVVHNGRGRVPPIHALIMAQYEQRQKQQGQQGQRGQAGEHPALLHPAPRQQQPVAAQPLLPKFEAAGPVQLNAVGATGGGCPVALGTCGSLHTLQQQVASSQDTASKRQRVLPAGPQLGGPHAAPAPARTQQGVPPLPSQQQQEQRLPGAPWLPPLNVAATVSTGKWEALSCLSAALGDLERSTCSAAHRQAQLDSALLAALRGNRCPSACVAVVKMLLEAGASAAATLDSRGRPALAVFLLGCESWRWGEEETASLVETLMAFGASATARDAQGLTPAERAVRMYSGAAVRGALRALAAARASLLQVDSSGRNLLHHAAAFSVGSQGLEAAIEVLLEAGCDPLAADSNGKLPCELLDSKPGRTTDGAARLLAEGMRRRSAADREAAAALRAQLDRQQCCVVCMQRPRTIGLMPCGHFAFCDGCVAACTACPLCRQAVTARLTIHAA